MTTDVQIALALILDAAKRGDRQRMEQLVNYVRYHVPAGYDFARIWDESLVVRDSRGRFAPRGHTPGAVRQRTTPEQALSAIDAFRSGKGSKEAVIAALAGLTIKELRELNKKFGLKLSGRSAELQERLKQLAIQRMEEQLAQQQAEPAKLQEEPASQADPVVDLTKLSSSELREQVQPVAQSPSVEQKSSSELREQMQAQANAPVSIPASTSASTSEAGTPVFANEQEQRRYVNRLPRLLNEKGREARLEVNGDTYYHRDRLKSGGWKWDPDRKVWWRKVPAKDADILRDGGESRIDKLKSMGAFLKRLSVAMLDQNGEPVTLWMDKEHVDSLKFHFGGKIPNYSNVPPKPAVTIPPSTPSTTSTTSAPSTVAPATSPSSTLSTSSTTSATNAATDAVAEGLEPYVPFYVGKTSEEVAQHRKSISHQPRFLDELGTEATVYATGDTYMQREHLKNFGWKWDPNKQLWIMRLRPEKADAIRRGGEERISMLKNIGIFRRGLGVGMFGKNGVPADIWMDVNHVDAPVFYYGEKRTNRLRKMYSKHKEVRPGQILKTKEGGYVVVAKASRPQYFEDEMLYYQEYQTRGATAEEIERAKIIEQADKDASEKRIEDI